MAGVWIYADRIETGRELLTLGRKLADGLGQSLTALLAGEQDLAQDFIARGADEVLLLPPLAEGQPVQDYVPLIAAEAQGADPVYSNRRQPQGQRNGGPDSSPAGHGLVQ